MHEKERIPIEKLEGYGCFACGTANPIGLDMHFYRCGDEICSDVTLKKYYEGWENMAHGGIISALLDEIMSWAVIYFKRVFFVTRKMEVKYVRPVPIGSPLRVKGFLRNGKERNAIRAGAEITTEDEVILARASGEYVELSRERLDAVPESLKKEMQKLFDRLD